MSFKILRSAALTVSWLVWSAASVTAAENIEELLKTIQQVGSEGAGHKAAQAAWRKLAAQDATALPQIMVGFDDANPLAANWLRSAVESILERERQRGTPLATADFEKYLQETRHDPRARRFAFELLVKADPAAKARLIPQMLNDPSVELRRDAVQEMIHKGTAAFDKKNLDEAKSQYQTAMTYARDPDQIEFLVKRLKELGVTVDLPRHFGFLMSWKVLGAFNNTGLNGFAAVFPPEEKLDYDATYIGKSGKSIRWKPYTSSDNYGSIDLNTAVEHTKEVVGYAATEFLSAKPQEVDIRLGTGNAWKLWVNGQLLFARGEYHRGKRVDQYRVRAKLNAGKNTILVKACQDSTVQPWTDDWQFQLRICDSAGTAILSTDREPSVSTKTAQSNMPSGGR